MPETRTEHPHYDLMVKTVRLLDPSFRVLDDMDIAVRDGRIAAIGKDLPGTADEILPGKGLLAMPGLVDAHHHNDQEWNYRFCRRRRSSHGKHR